MGDDDLALIVETDSENAVNLIKAGDIINHPNEALIQDCGSHGPYDSCILEDKKIDARICLRI